MKAVTKYVALLRGINLGRNKRVSMAELKSILESLKFTEVATLLQSGNVMFKSPVRDTLDMANEIEHAIEEHLALKVRVIVRTVAEVTRLMKENPLPLATSEPARFHLTFLSDDPPGERIVSIDPAMYAPDEFRFGDRAVYVWYRGGILGSKLTHELWEKRLGVIATARNWNTVTRLVELGSESSPAGS